MAHRLQEVSRAGHTECLKVQKSKQYVGLLDVNLDFGKLVFKSSEERWVRLHNKKFKSGTVHGWTHCFLAIHQAIHPISSNGFWGSAPPSFHVWQVQMRPHVGTHSRDGASDPGLSHCFPLSPSDWLNGQCTVQSPSVRCCETGWEFTEKRLLLVHAGSELLSTISLWKDERVLRETCQNKESSV